MARNDTTYSTSDFSRKSGDIIAEALRRPVTITQRSKPRLVILNIEDYERMRQQADARVVGTLETMPDALLDEIETAIEAYAQDDEGVRP
ncbi:type II toxin-antitoxin system prevent-host-death family antitoxin [Salmonella enterica subsp. enterica]|jgi:prevent-host-death family protein|nr:type II toxin-antitoxin system prevent-host-death family antitoxin [Salmonella enterica subsp. enterica]EFG8200480.1 type II toxin-antitoxin system prevent-host-death family antitoxin [Escherichia coli]EFG9153134.1 type II toxin-antitoxin system prevent-host-death family antitoxin [Escherichia coli]MIL10217.1 type II toxin-antitoxin system prevent-host-death family antitoxin [Salmonella enterica subsp. enterica serovar Enteritidis]